MAFRSNVKVRTTKPTSKIIKIIACICVAIAMLVGGFILYFNGQNVKAPLLKFLSDRTSFSISCEQVEFSPIYPDVLKLKNISINKSHIKEIYVEYDLKSIIASDSLKIKYFFARDLNLDEGDIQTLKKEKFRFNDIEIDKLDLVNTPLTIGEFDTATGSISATNALIDAKGKFSFEQGDIKAKEATIAGFETKHVMANVSDSADKILLHDVSMQVFGGTLSAELSIDKANHEINFSRLVLNKILFHDVNSLNNYTIKADNVAVNNCVLALNKEDLIMGEIRGKMTSLNVNKGDIKFKFDGKVGEISKPSIQISADDSYISSEFSKDKVAMTLRGKIFSGDYQTDVTIDKTNPEAYKLIVNDFKLSNAKLEPTLDDYNYIYKTLFAHSTTIAKASIDSTEFVSNINTLPLSIKAISLQASNLDFNDESKKIESEYGQIKFGFDSALYSDLFIKTLESTTKFSPKFISVQIPTLATRHSKLSSDFSYVYDTEDLKFKLQAKDFDIAELNSSVFERMFDGKLNLDVNLHSENYPDRVNSLNYNLQGSINLTADSLLVSRFGLDLINGGTKKNYQLKTDELVDAIQDGDCGLYKLNARAKITDGSAKYKVSTDLTTSHLTLNGKFNLDDKQIHAKSTFVSLAKDSMTSLIANGPYDNLIFFITALSRGEIRPGINEESISLISKEKENTKEAPKPDNLVIDDSKEQSK